MSLALCAISFAMALTSPDLVSLILTAGWAFLSGYLVRLLIEEKINSND